MTHVAGKDWVLVVWTGAVLCPWHGEQDPEQGYTVGRARCGCDFQPLPGGKLRAVEPARSTEIDRPVIAGGAMQLP